MTDPGYGPLAQLLVAVMGATGLWPARTGTVTLTVKHDKACDWRAGACSCLPSIELEAEPAPDTGAQVIGGET